MRTLSPRVFTAERKRACLGRLAISMTDAAGRLAESAVRKGRPVRALRTLQNERRESTESAPPDVLRGPAQQPLLQVIHPGRGRVCRAAIGTRSHRDYDVLTLFVIEVFHPQ